MDRRSRQNHRRRQTRAPSVRFDPLGLLLSASMAGTLLYEVFVREEMTREIVDRLDRALETKVPKIPAISASTAELVHKIFSERPPGITGLRLVSDQRRGYQGYYDWIKNTSEQQLVFAGRSVLHRIDADVRDSINQSAEDVILSKLRNGSRIRINFLDPYSCLIERLAKEEGQRPEDMLSDIATSIGICRRLGDLLTTEAKTLPKKCDLSIRIYDQVPYFAYHKQNEQVIVGFYFQSFLGSTSAAYEIIDSSTKELFSSHFVRIHSEVSSSTLVEFNGERARPRVENELFERLVGKLSESLTQTRVNELMKRSIR
jgi:hypothetical protein